MAWSRGNKRAGECSVAPPLVIDLKTRHLRQILAPKVLQGIIAAVNDYFTAKLAFNVFGSQAHSHAAVSTIPKSSVGLAVMQG